MLDIDKNEVNKFRNGYKNGAVSTPQVDAADQNRRAVLDYKKFRSATLIKEFIWLTGYIFWIVFGCEREVF